ncbi:hypothetical protein MBBTH_21650 [Methanobrevibacter thaueri]|uniref:Uncharacterized protein n=1 Tax=Methanobrevibacter thaueri TaxID=190975 RepID=A0A315XKQ0_9EURY|nr:hypothetical protein MBBTH_21650 [Methanobrevibacter thaueri]
MFEDSECFCSAVSIILVRFVNCSSDSVVTRSQSISVYYDFTVNNWIFNTINGYVNNGIVLNSNSEVGFDFIVIIYSNIHTGSMFNYFKYCTVECSIVFISFGRSCNNSVITNNISIKGVITICIRSVDHTINSNNNRSGVGYIEYKFAINHNNFRCIYNNSSILFSNNIEYCSVC